ncbi:YczE/YyaS/YitT family protein [Anaerobacillus sp. MEB173]|uniref:YczE/YyaS/YitT family protein n=1 Tax=Anaerobacillus sp. MEB173 TaxID=3383345 RepID=UPI003F906437
MGKRITIYIVGLLISALGICLIIKSEAGTGPWDTVAVGLNLHFGLTIGGWSIIAQAIVVMLTSIIEQKAPQIGSIVAIIIRSMFLDLWIYVVFINIDFTTSIITQWLIFSIGLIVVGVGIGLYLIAEFPKTPIDGLMVALNTRFGWSFSNARIIIESFAVLLGFLLGGPVGIGTVITAILLGRIIQISNKNIRILLIKEEKKTSLSA